MCSCAEPEPISTALKNADAVFTGRVLEIDEPFIQTSSIDPIRVTFEVNESWKGADFKIAQIHTASSEVSCGYPDFEKGKDFLVFAHQRSNGLETSLCGRTNPIAKAKIDLAVLHEIQTPITPEGTMGFDGRISTALTLAAAVLFAALFFALWKKILLRWSKAKRILLTLLYWYVSIGILLAIYSLQYGPTPEPLDFLISIGYISVLWLPIIVIRILSSLVL